MPHKTTWIQCIKYGDYVEMKFFGENHGILLVDSQFYLG